MNYLSVYFKIYFKSGIYIYMGGYIFLWKNSALSTERRKVWALFFVYLDIDMQRVSHFRAAPIAVGRKIFKVEEN